MAENSYRINTFKEPEKEKDKEKEKRKKKSKSRFGFGFLKDPRFELTLGFFLLITSIFLFIAFLSYIFTEIGRAHV